MNKGQLLEYKDELDTGVAYALAKTTERDGDKFERVWIELVGTPGKGSLRSLVDDSEYLLFALRRSIYLLKQWVARMPNHLKNLIVGEMKRLLEMDFIIHHSAVFTQHGMELAALICVLQVLFNRHGKPSDLFLGFFDAELGEFYHGGKAVPMPNEDDVYAMRRAGVTRLFIGTPVITNGPTTDQDQEVEVIDVDGPKASEQPLGAQYQAMVDAAKEDLGANVRTLEIVILANYERLVEYLDLSDPDKSIFSDRPLRK